jgi:hypothetical protein
MISMILFLFTSLSGYFLFITGFIGNSLNLFVLTQSRAFRGHQAAFYLIIGSIIDVLQLIFSTAAFTTAVTFDLDPTRTILIWCKIRAFIATFSDFMSSTIVCLAAIDQYLSTHYIVQMQRISSLQTAQRSTIIAISIILISCLPVFILHTVDSRLGCKPFDPMYNTFKSFVHVSFLIGLFLLLTTSLFTLFAYRHIHGRARRRLDRQSTTMIILRVILYILTTLPSVVMQIVRMNTIEIDSSDTSSVVIDRYLRTLIMTVSSVNYSVIRT